jgi:hypothetical protein
MKRPFKLQFMPSKPGPIFVIYDNDYPSIIDIYFLETFSTLNSNIEVLVLHSLDTLSHVRIKAFMLLF